jgi:hypothetical protein
MDFVVHPHPPTPTRCLIIIWCPTIPSVELGMQLHQRKLTTRLSVAGGNIGDDRVNIFCRGMQQNQRSGLAENITFILCRQWYFI